MPPSISRCGWCRPIAATRAMPASSTRCCAASPARARSELAGLDTTALDTPDWLMARWLRNYGADTARAIALANGREPALDLTVKGERRALGARRSAAACCRPARCARRCMARCRVAAGLRRGRLVGAGRRRRAAGEAARRRRAAAASPTCAPRPAARPRSSPPPAPAWSRSTARRRGSSGCGRISRALRSTAETVAADVAEWQAGPFDAVLLDAPCSSTGTIRRHPDIPWLKREADIAALAALQRRLIARAVELTKPGGLLVYCTCSLEPEEGDRGRPRPARPRSAPAPPAGRRGRGRRPRRADQPGRRPAHPALPARRPGPAHGRARRLLRRPTRKDLKDLSPVGRRPALPLWSGRPRGPGSPARREPQRRCRAFRSRNVSDCPCSWRAACFADPRGACSPIRWCSGRSRSARPTVC